MLDDHHPTIDVSFLRSRFENNPKVLDSIKVGDTTAYVLKGKRPISKRIVLLREVGGQVDYMFATGIAIKLDCMGELLEWLEKNRNWKDGAYTSGAATPEP